MTVELSLFEHVSDLVRGLVPREIGDLRMQVHRRGIKIWFDTTEPSKEHFEAQQLSRRYIDGRNGRAIEIGFHAEHPSVERNDAVIDDLMASEASWRQLLGDEPQAGTFFGSDTWRRLSETWIEPDLDQPDLAFEVATRIVDYITSIQPVRSE